MCSADGSSELEGWFSQVRYVRGQNMADDFTSTFCSKARFLDDLATLIERTDTRWVVLSYFNGRNHWNDFNKDPNGVGKALLTEFFTHPMFEGAARIRPIGRTNYQSYGGYRARRVDEYLFVAKKRQ